MSIAERMYTLAKKTEIVQIDTSVRGRTFRLAETIVENHGDTTRARDLGDTMIELAERAGAYGGRLQMQVKDGAWSMSFDASQPTDGEHVRSPREADRATELGGAPPRELAQRNHYRDETGDPCR